MNLLQANRKQYDLRRLHNLIRVRARRAAAANIIVFSFLHSLLAIRLERESASSSIKSIQFYCRILANWHEVFSFYLILIWIASASAHVALSFFVSRLKIDFAFDSNSFDKLKATRNNNKYFVIVLVSLVVKQLQFTLFMSSATFIHINMGDQSRLTCNNNKYIRTKTRLIHLWVAHDDQKQKRIPLVQ